MKNKKQAALGAFILSLLLLTLMACNVGHLTQPLEVESPTVCPEKPRLTVKLIDLPGNCVTLKEAKLTLTDPSGQCKTQVWKCCAPGPIGFDFKESGCYKFCVEITGDNGAKFYYSGSFPLELKEQYNVDIRFEKGIITATFKKLSPEKTKSWIINAIPDTNSPHPEAGLTLAFNPKEEPALLYKSNPYKRFAPIIYGVRAGKSWQFESCGTGKLVGSKSLTFDSSGIPVVGYIDGAVPTLFVAKSGGSGESWKSTKVSSAGHYFAPPYLTRDSKGLIHMLYDHDKGSSPPAIWSYSILNSDLKNVSSNNPAHSIERLGYIESHIIDSKDSYSFTYSQYSAWSRDSWYLMYRSRESGEETDEYLPFIKGTFNNKPAGGHSLAVDSKDIRALAYFDNIEKKLYYSARVNGKWQSETVESAELTYGNCSLVFDSKDRAIIAFYDSNSQDLKVARQTGKGWEITTIDSEGDVGTASVIKVDSKDNIYIAYFDRTNKRVKLAEYR